MQDAVQDAMQDANDAQDVLEAIERDARRTTAEIAEATGRPAESVRAAIDDAEAGGLILSWGARINWDAAGRPRICALVEVTVDPQDSTGYNQVARRIARFDEVRTVYFVSGDYDLMVMVEGATMQDIAEFVSERLAPMPAVRHTTTHMLMKRYKEAGVQLDVEEEVSRQKVVF